MVYMRTHILISLLVLIAMSIGAGHAKDIDTGDVEALSKPWNKMDSPYSKAR